MDMNITLDQAMRLLNTAVREELRDHAFGDTEVDWVRAGATLASGYFSGTVSQVTILMPPSYPLGEDGFIQGVNFDGDDARKLRECGTTLRVSRNDETGPDDYTEGDTMPGLSLGDVFYELTGTYLDEKEN